MEDIYRDSFEQMLRENADRFIMNPSRRVWTSLYNNMHPSKRWPSPGTWLLIVSLLFVMDSPVERRTILQNASLNESSVTNRSLLNSAETNPVISRDPHPAQGESHLLSRTIIAGKINSKKETGHVTYGETPVIDNQVASEDNTVSTGKSDLIVILNRLEKQKKAKRQVFAKSEYSARVYYQASAVKGELPVGDPENPRQRTEEKNTATGKFGYEIYATPSIGFRGTSRGTSGNMETDMNYLPDPAMENERKAIPAFNLEAGGSISYALSEIMRFKAGLQLNYSKYNPGGDDNEQPATAFLLQGNDPAGSPGGFDMQGTDRRMLSNQSYQLSLPLGADVKIADAQNIEWFAGASVQPTFILPGSAILQNQDADFYMPDAGMIRNWNINGGIETFISYHAGKGIRLNAGPQLRYQLLSSFKNQFMPDERLYNIGIKLGISSRF